MKRIILLLVPLLFAATACEHSDPVREEMIERAKNLPAVTNVGYESQGSNATTMVIYWDAASSIEAGATSFRIQLSEDEYFYEGDGSTIKTYEVKTTAYTNDAIMITGLTSGQGYYVRVASVYPGPNVTTWANLCNAQGKVVAVIPGVGLVE